MLSTLPKLADRTFVLGFFLPTLLFTIAALLLFSHVSDIGEWLKSLTAKDLTTGAYLLLAVWVGALLLLILNH
jgi:ABC-type sulfate transport system permease component